MRNNTSLIYSIFLLIGDFFAILLGFTLAYIVRFKLLENSKLATIGGSEFVLAIISILPIWLVVHGLIGLYRQEVYERRFVELGRLFVGATLGVMAIISYSFVTESNLLPGRSVPLYALLISFFILAVFRAVARLIRHILYRHGSGVSNILIIGNNISSINLARSICNTKHTGLKVIGIVGCKHPKFKYFSSFENALVKLNNQPIHGIIQTELYSDTSKNNLIFQYAQTHHVSYRFVPGNGDLFVGNIAVELFAGLPVIAVHQTPLVGWGRVSKRLLDVFLSLFGIIITSPVIVLVAIVMKIIEPSGPVFFKQVRLTRFNRQFNVYKFRTNKLAYNGLSPEEAFTSMGKPALIKKYRDGGDFLSNDPRYGRFGNFLRRTSLDELPQLLNVLKGDISLVGPRALIPAELNKFEKKHAILSVKSGLTGLAQISGRRDISFEERRTLDVYYVQNWSFWLDISIIIRTIRAVLNGTGGK